MSRFCQYTHTLYTLTYEIFNFFQAADLRCRLNYHTPSRSLRSANTNLLSVSRVRTTFASRGFNIAAPTVLNSLPSSIRSSTSAYAFRRLLKLKRTKNVLNENKLRESKIDSLICKT